MKGKITIGQYSNYRGEDDLSVHIQIEDDISGTHFLELHMTPRDFGQAILGRGCVDCEFELRTQNVGKVRETKVEEIYMEHSAWKESEEGRKLLLTPYEVDGWHGYFTDLGNHHKVTRQDKKGSYYQVGFIRFVDAQVSEE